MKKSMIAVLMLAMVAVTSCGGSNSTPSDTTPEEVHVIALMGALTAFVSNNVSVSHVGGTALDEGPGTAIITSDQVTFADAFPNYKGTVNDTNMIDSCTYTLSGTQSAFTIAIAQGGRIYYSNAYDTYPTGGALITWNSVDYTATTTSTSVTGETYLTITGDSTLSPVSFTSLSGYHSTATTTGITVDISSPSVATGTVTFTSGALTAAVENGSFRQSIIGMTFAVNYSGADYTCSVTAVYDEPTASSAGNTGVGELAPTLVSCSVVP